MTQISQESTIDRASTAPPRRDFIVSAHDTEQKTAQNPAWVTGSVADFLGMTPGEAFVMEVWVGLKTLLREARSKSGLTQAEVAEKMGSAQSRVAKLEAPGGTRSATIDLMLRAAFAAGATVEEVGAVFADAVSYAINEVTGAVGLDDIPVSTK